MSEFYRICTSIAVIAFIACLIGLLITFDPLGWLIGRIRRGVPERRIRRARQTIERYDLDRVLTDNERKAIVLEYLEDTGMIVTKGATPWTSL